MAVMTIIELDNSALRSTVAFTGRLACMSRADAFEVVRSHGGTPRQAVTRQTSVLVVGELGWPLLDDGRPSNKLSRAGSYGIPVVSERRFLEWIGKAVPDSLHRTYSADQIAALSKLSSSTIDELVRFGLLVPREGLFGFRDLASARQVSSLFANGIALSEIIRSVKEVRAWLPEANLSNLRLHPAAHRPVRGLAALYTTAASPAEAGHVREGMQPLSVPSVYKKPLVAPCTLLALELEEEEERERLD